MYVIGHILSIWKVCLHSFRPSQRFPFDIIRFPESLNLFPQLSIKKSNSLGIITSNRLVPTVLNYCQPFKSCYVVCLNSWKGCKTCYYDFPDTFTMSYPTIDRKNTNIFRCINFKKCLRIHP